MFRRLCLRPGRPRTDLPASDTRATTLNSVCGIVPPLSIGVSFPLSLNGRLFWQSSESLHQLRLSREKIEEIFVMKKLLLICLALCVMFMMVGVTFAADSTTVNGYVSDSKCGAKGANAKAAECTKKCVKAGEKLVVVTDGDQKVLAVDNPDTLTGHEGHHVAVTGQVTGESIHVESVKML